jgi:hypothetical protein
MKHWFLLMFWLFASALQAQNVVAGSFHASDLLPHPFVYAGPEGMGSGYAPLAMLGGAGIRIDSSRFILETTAWYDNGHKRDIGKPNPKGHDRGLEGAMYFRLASGWAFGGGAAWSQLSTTNYTKSSWRPTVGGNKDFFVRDCESPECRGQFTMRVGADYVLPGKDWENGSQGPSIMVYIPSPSLKRHLFFREQLGIYRYHDTVTDRTNPILTRDQTSKHGFDAFLELTIMYRF